MTPDLNTPWHDLGLTRGNGRLELDGSAPLAAIREAVTAGRGTWHSAGAMRLPFTFNRRSVRAGLISNICIPQLQLMQSQKMLSQRDGAARQFASRLRLRFNRRRCRLNGVSSRIITLAANVWTNRKCRAAASTRTEMPQSLFDQTGFASSVTGEVTTRNTRSTRPELEIACSTPGGRKMKSCFLTTWLLPAISISPSPSST